MTTTRLTRRTFVRNAGGIILAAAGGLVLPGTVAAVDEMTVCYCGYDYHGPIHSWLRAYGVDPVWQHDIVWRESNFLPSATNPYSSAAGLAQFLWSTWSWGEERFGIYGSPYNWVTNLEMFNAFLRVGEYSHWACTVESGCAG